MTMKKAFILPILVVVALGVAVYLWAFPRGMADSIPTARAEKKVMRIVLSEEGTIQPYEFVRIKADLTSVDGAKIVYVIPNGTFVRKGDKLLELDSAEIDRAISKAKLEIQSAETEFINAKEEKKKTELDRELNIREAEFNLEVARSNLERYTEVEYQKELDHLKVTIEKAQVHLEEARENLEAARELFADGLVPEFEVRKNEIALKEAEFAHRKARSDLELFEKYKHPLKLKELQNAVESTERLLESRKSYFEAILSQRESVLANAKYSLEEAKRNLKKLQQDRKNLIIKAPVEGIVNYGEPATGVFSLRGSGDIELKIGETVRAQETIMYIPDLRSMFLKLEIDEVDISKLLLSGSETTGEEQPEEEVEVDLASLTEEDFMNVFMKAGDEARKVMESIDFSRVDTSSRDPAKMLAALSPADQEKLQKFFAKYLGKKPATRFKRLPVNVKADGFPDAKITGIVDYVAGAAHADSWFEETSKFEVKVKLDQTYEWFRPGMKMRADILVEETPELICVPVDAVFSKDDKKVCYVKRGGKFLPVEVVTGRSDDVFIEIQSGINQGDVVALKNPEKR